MYAVRTITPVMAATSHTGDDTSTPHGVGDATLLARMQGPADTFVLGHTPHNTTLHKFNVEYKTPTAVGKLPIIQRNLYMAEIVINRQKNKQHLTLQYNAHCTTPHVKFLSTDHIFVVWDAYSAVVFDVDESIPGSERERRMQPLPGDAIRSVTLAANTKKTLIVLTWESEIYTYDVATYTKFNGKHERVWSKRFVQKAKTIQHIQSVDLFDNEEGLFEVPRIGVFATATEISFFRVGQKGSWMEKDAGVRKESLVYQSTGVSSAEWIPFYVRILDHDVEENETLAVFAFARRDGDMTQHAIGKFTFLNSAAHNVNTIVVYDSNVIKRNVGGANMDNIIRTDDIDECNGVMVLGTIRGIVRSIDSLVVYDSLNSAAVTTFRSRVIVVAVAAGSVITLYATTIRSQIEVVKHSAVVSKTTVRGNPTSIRVTAGPVKSIFADTTDASVLVVGRKITITCYTIGDKCLESFVVDVGVGIDDGISDVPIPIFGSTPLVRAARTIHAIDDATWKSAPFLTKTMSGAINVRTRVSNAARNPPHGDNDILNFFNNMFQPNPFTQPFRNMESDHIFDAERIFLNRSQKLDAAKKRRIEELTIASTNTKENITAIENLVSNAKSVGPILLNIIENIRQTQSGMTRTLTELTTTYDSMNSAARNMVTFANSDIFPVNNTEPLETLKAIHDQLIMPMIGIAKLTGSHDQFVRDRTLTIPDRYAEGVLNNVDSLMRIHLMTLIAQHRTRVVQPVDTTFANNKLADHAEHAWEINYTDSDGHTTTAVENMIADEWSLSPLTPTNILTQTYQTLIDMGMKGPTQQDGNAELPIVNRLMFLFVTSLVAWPPPHADAINNILQRMGHGRLQDQPTKNTFQNIIQTLPALVTENDINWITLAPIAGQDSLVDIRLSYEFLYYVTREDTGLLIDMQKMVFEPIEFTLEDLPSDVPQAQGNQGNQGTLFTDTTWGSNPNGLMNFQPRENSPLDIDTFFMDSS